MRPGSIASGRSRTAGTVSASSKNSWSRGRSWNSRLAKPTACSRRVMSNPAKAVKVTISPTEVWPFMLSQMPTTKIGSTVSVVEARVGAAQQHLHQAAGVNAAVKAQWQLQDVLEIAGHHRVAAAMRQPVGMQCHQ